MRIPIHLQREIARLHYYDPNSSDRAIAGTVGMSPSTIGSFRRMLRKQGHEWSAIEPLDDDQWRDTLGTRDRSIAQRKPLPDWQWVHTEMQRPDATMEQL